MRTVYCLCHQLLNTTPTPNTTITLCSPDVSNLNVLHSNQKDIRKLNKITDLLGPNWVNDDTIGEYYEILNNKVLNTNKLLCMNPIVCQAVKILDDYNFILDPLNLKTTKYLFMPVSDATIPASEQTEVHTGVY